MSSGFLTNKKHIISSLFTIFSGLQFYLPRLALAQNLCEHRGTNLLYVGYIFFCATCPGRLQAQTLLITNQATHLLDVHLPLLLHPFYFYHIAPIGQLLVHTLLCTITGSLVQPNTPTGNPHASTYFFHPHSLDSRHILWASYPACAKIWSTLSGFCLRYCRLALDLHNVVV